MKAITNTNPGKLEWRDWPLPKPGRGQVRIRTGACGICATDMHMIAGWARTGFPSIPGHEWAGTVDAVGSGSEEKLLGRRCVGENVISTGGEVGFEHPGGYGEYFLTESANIHPLPDDYPLTIATLMEPLAVSVRGINKLHLDNCQSAAIMGDGSIGLLVLMILKRTGVKDILMVGGRDPHLALAKEIGARHTINYHHVEHGFVNAVNNEVEFPFPIVIEASGSVVATQTCMQLVQPCGQILVLGDYGRARADFEWNHLLHQEIKLIGSNASAEAWPEALHMAVEGNLPMSRLVTHTLPAEKFIEGVELTRSRRGDVIKVVLEWQET